MIDATISEFVSTLDKVNYYLSPVYLAELCNSYYYSICGYNTHWDEICSGSLGELYLNDPSQSRSHAIFLSKANKKLKSLIKELNLSGIEFNLVNRDAENKVITIPSYKNALAISAQVRLGKLWDENEAVEWIVAIPELRRLITVSSSSKNRKMLNFEVEDCPEFIINKELSLKNVEVNIERIKIPPYISKCKVLSEGGITPRSIIRERLWDLDFLYKLPGVADINSQSLRLVDNEVTFEHLLALSHPTDHGKIILGQYYLSPLCVTEYEYETGTEISQRALKVVDEAGEHIFYINNKNGRKIERSIENDGVSYIIAFVKQYYGTKSKHILDYKIINKKEYDIARKISFNNYQHDKNVRYLSFDELHSLRDYELLPEINGYAKGDRVVNKVKSNWGTGTVLGLRNLINSEYNAVARVEFQYAGIKEIVLEKLTIVKKTNENKFLFEPKQLAFIPEKGNMTIESKPSQLKMNLYK